MATKRVPFRQPSSVDESVNVNVILRCRPPSTEELAQRVPQVVKCNEANREVTLTQNINGKQFGRTYHFDKVFPADTTQEKLYTTAVAPIVEEVLEGFNCTIFAYGQTGTGKTHTMTGDLGAAELTAASGVIPRAIQQIFAYLDGMGAGNEYTVKCSYLELYNEEITDLLAGTNETIPKVRLMEDRSGVVLQGLEETNVKTSTDIFSLLEQGSARRRTAETLLNKQSSRSHSVFIITVSVRELLAEGEEVIRVGKLYLVDLAGSENVTRSGAVDQRAKEAGNINKSLLTLGRVITALVEGQGHVPYRDSKLTRILRDSLGGRTKTCVIATIAPTVHCQEETLSTLDYAHRAKNIKNKPEVNQKVTKTTHLKEMSVEIMKLKQELAAQRDKNGVFLPAAQYDEECEERRVALARVEQLEEELQAVEGRHEEEKTAMTEEFEAQKAVLEATLAETRSELEVTVAALRAAEQAIREKDFLIQAHRTSEEALAGHALSLTDQLKAAAGDVALLFNRVDIKNGLEEDNHAVVQGLRDAAVDGLTAMETAVAATATAQAARFADTKQALTEFTARKEAEAARVAQQMAELEAKITAVGAAADAAASILSDQGSQALATLESTQVEYLAAAKQAAEEASTAVAEAYAALNASLAKEQSELASFLEEQSEASTAVYAATQTIVSAVQSQLQAAKAQAEEAQAAIASKLASQVEAVTALEEEFTQTAAAGKAELMQQMITLVDSFMAKTEEQIRTAAGDIKNQLSEDQASLSACMNKMASDANKSLTTLSANASAAETAHAAGVETAQHGGQQLSERMTATATQIQATMEKTKSEAKDALNALQKHTKSVKSEVKYATQSLASAAQAEAKKCAGAAAAAVAIHTEVVESLSKDHAADMDTATHMEANSANGAAEIEAFAGDQRWKLAELTATVRTAVDEQYKLDKERTAVPSRRKVPVPPVTAVQKLRAGPEERLLAEFRGEIEPQRQLDNDNEDAEWNNKEGTEEHFLENVEQHAELSPTTDTKEEEEMEEEEEEEFDAENQDPSDTITTTMSHGRQLAVDSDMSADADAAPPENVLSPNSLRGQKRIRSPEKSPQKSLKGAFNRAERRRTTRVLVD